MTRLAVAFVIGIPVMWLCWFAYLLALWCARGIYWIKGVRT
jgi:hypothetical protein